MYALLTDLLIIVKRVLYTACTPFASFVPRLSSFVSPPQLLPHHKPEELHIIDQITLPQPPRFHQETPEPFEAGFLHPDRRALHHSGHSGRLRPAKG